MVPTLALPQLPLAMLLDPDSFLPAVAADLDDLGAASGKRVPMVAPTFPNADSEDITVCRRRLRWLRCANGALCGGRAFVKAAVSESEI